MTAVPRDPAFWKRFSAAARLDKEARSLAVTAPSSGRHQQGQMESWLESQNRKRRRSRIIISTAFLAVTLFVLGLVLFLVWLSSNGWFIHGN
jgi:hypothetical protein